MVKELRMTEKEQLKEALSFIQVCRENIQYQHEILIDIDTDFQLLVKIARQNGWK
jgi:hypothetical protein